MKVHNTQRIFWKKWPYKAIVKISETQRLHSFRFTREQRMLRQHEFQHIKIWCEMNLVDFGIRCETNASVFVNTSEELDKLVDHWGERVIEVWQPENDSAKELLMGHSYDVVRANPWYGRFPIRARIHYDDNFRHNAIPLLKSAVAGLDPTDWHARGLLYELLTKDKQPKHFGWGQPLHLYLATNDDAAMLRLQCGDYIQRFERIRSPD